MHYLYSEKSFARDLFDAAKAKLGKSSFDASALPRHWLDGVNYAGNIFTPFTFNNRVKFRSTRGLPLRTTSAPLCTRDPAIICRLPDAARHTVHESKTESLSESQQESASGAAAQPGFEPRAGMPPYASAGPVHNLQPDDSALPPGGRTSEHTRERPDDSADHAMQPPPLWISTPVLSTVLALAVAITGGIIIGNNNSFRLDVTPSKRSAATPVAVQASADDAISNPRLALDTTPPQALASVAGATSAPRIRQHRRDEASADHVVARQAANKKVHVQSRNASQLRASKKNRKTVPASSAVVAHKAPARPAPNIAVAAAKPLPSRQSTAQPGTLYARCEKLRGLVRQERCRWKACGGKWGKQGCPAYQHKTMLEVGLGQVHQPGS